MLPGIRWHHEALNGRGYPDGIKGDELPMMARIISVADTFDAITTNRPYQPASDFPQGARNPAQTRGHQIRPHRRGRPGFGSGQWQLGQVRNVAGGGSRSPA